MASDAPAAIRPVPGGRPDRTRNCRTQVCTGNARFRGKVQARTRPFLAIITKIVRADMAPQSRRRYFVWDRAG